MSDTTALPKPVPVLCEGSGLPPTNSTRCQVCGVAPFLITNNTMPEHQRRHFPDVELEAIVRDLAAHGAPPDHTDPEACWYCEARVFVNPDDGESEPHDSGCPSLLATAWVSAHPVSGTNEGTSGS